MNVYLFYYTLMTKLISNKNSLLYVQLFDCQLEFSRSMKDSSIFRFGGWIEVQNKSSIYSGTDGWSRQCSNSYLYPSSDNPNLCWVTAFGCRRKFLSNAEFRECQMKNIKKLFISSRWFKRNFEKNNILSRMLILTWIWVLNQRIHSCGQGDKFLSENCEGFFNLD